MALMAQTVYYAAWRVHDLVQLLFSARHFSAAAAKFCFHVSGVCRDARGICVATDVWPAPNSHARLRVQVIGQKVIVYPSVLSVLIQALAADRLQRKYRIEPAANRAWSKRMDTCVGLPWPRGPMQVELAIGCRSTRKS
jgi:hypothetical protein